MLAFSTMHDHGFHGGPILMSNSPPRPHMHPPPQGLMSQDNFKHHSRFEAHAQEQHHLLYAATHSNGRYDLTPPQLHHHPDHLVQFGPGHQQKDHGQTLPYMPSWQYSNVVSQQHQHPKHQADQKSTELRVGQSMQVQAQKDSEEFARQHEPFSKQAIPFGNSHMVNDLDFEDVDEDDISDLEEEEELRRSYEMYRQQLARPDVTSRLLVFADVISSDLKKYFGRTKEQDDSCDVYEDKWATTKSGRELYYADLLRIAQGDMEPASKTVQKTLSSSGASTSSYASSSPSLSPKGDGDNRFNFKGVRDVSIGMGPLTELFDYGLKNVSTDNRRSPSSSFRAKQRDASSGEEISKHPESQNRGGNQNASNVTPMHERNLPESFWKEPGTVINPPSCSDPQQRLEMLQQGGVLASSRLPDFSDLVESWQGSVEGMEAAHNSQRLNLSIEQSRF